LLPRRASRMFAVLAFLAGGGFGFALAMVLQQQREI
jgi:hypothetical protein